MVYENVQFVLLGTGDARYEDFMRSREWKYKGRLAAYIGYNEDLAHLIYAGSDFFLMPSRFEPCGLSQMICSRNRKQYPDFRSDSGRLCPCPVVCRFCRSE